MSSSIATERLRRADRDREKGSGGLSEAVLAYACDAAHVDPATPDGAARVRWLLDLSRALPFELEDLMRRAAAEAPELALRRAARLAVARFAVRRSRFPEAETILRDVLHEVRGTGTAAEHEACLHLSAAYRAQRREFEALVLARRAAVVAKTLGDPASAVASLVQLCATLMEIGEWGPFDVAVAEIEWLAPLVPPARLAPVLRSLDRYRAQSLLERGDPDGARAALDSSSAEGADSWSRADDERKGLVLRARCDLAAGNVEGALGAAERAVSSSAEGSAGWIRAAALLVPCLARSGARRAPTAGGAVLDVLDAVGTAIVGTGGVQRAAATIGLALERFPGAGGEALRAFEIAASAMFARTAEMHASIAEVSELSEAIAEDREMLTRFGRRYLDEHEAMLSTIARLHDAGVVDEPLHLAPLVAADGVIRVCAWCLCVRAEDGTQLPVGHFLPDSTRFSVTHGICPSCAQRYGA